jgi:ABC-type polysaccharide/polyol phosphate export permease
MRQHLLIRIVAASVLAIIIGCIMHSLQQKNIHMGRDAFIAKEATSYDHDLRLSIHPTAMLVSSVIISLFAFGILFSTYELIVFSIVKILERKSDGDSSSE